MALRSALLLSLALLAAAPARAGDIVVSDAFARILPGAKAGAVYLLIRNDGSQDDRLVSAATPIAEMTELHTSLQSADGMMQMLPIDDGIVLPAQGEHALESGGDHLMLMGLTDRPAPGDSFPLTLTFEQAGDIVVEVPVDNNR